ncbi:hypothetical protein RND71_035540 [Anisodus tanguticus]|uniref:Uncharacterized protein n=1 Tax=Anisodus tanguticus TaxID=243964 RepID=A0AAE1R619_9SOLA|nr:hypothetical protein RND71_035540 [Anisodus tanguticus]
MNQSFMILRQYGQLSKQICRSSTTSPSLSHVSSIDWRTGYSIGLSNANIGENPMPRKPKGSSARFVHGESHNGVDFLVCLGATVSDKPRNTDRLFRIFGQT